jgi:hypothetical protein
VTWCAATLFLCVTKLYGHLVRAGLLQQAVSEIPDPSIAQHASLLVIHLPPTDLFYEVADLMLQSLLCCCCCLIVSLILLSSTCYQDRSHIRRAHDVTRPFFSLPSPPLIPCILCRPVCPILVGVREMDGLGAGRLR